MKTVAEFEVQSGFHSDVCIQVIVYGKSDFISFFLLCESIKIAHSTMCLSATNTPPKMFGSRVIMNGAYLSKSYKAKN